MTFLGYMLDLYFGTKEMNHLKAQGKVSEEEEFFVGYGFPGTVDIELRLIKRGLTPFWGREKFPWYRVLQEKLGQCRIEVLKGWENPKGSRKSVYGAVRSANSCLQSWVSPRS